jgi:hypothetical protein
MSAVGQEAVNAGMKGFSLTVSIRDRLTSDLVVEFNQTPPANTLRPGETAFGAVTIEGSTVRLTTSMEADELRQKFSRIADSDVGQRLAALIEAARYLPAPPAAAPKHNKPVIYGLDGGPREVN